MGFNSFDDIIKAITVDEDFNVGTFSKTGTAPEAAGFFYSFWKDGTNPAAGANPAAGSATPGAGGTAYDLTDGALVKFADVEGGGATRHLIGFQGQATSDCTLIIYDRLVGVGGISVASTGNKDIGSVALPRYTDGVGVECWLEFSTASTATVGAASLASYTDQDGNGSSVGGSKSFPAAATNVGTFVQMPIAAGDYGIQAVQTLNVGTATTAGVVNLVLIKPLLYIPLLADLGVPYDLVYQLPSMPRLYDGATLGAYILASSGTAVTVQGMLLAVHKV